MFYEPKSGHGLPRNPFKALVSPRPIAWVSTVDAAGAVNLAPFSYFNAVHDDPPILMIAPNGPKPGVGGVKDTLANILATEEFVVNVTPTALKDAMNVTAAAHAAGVDEFEAAGLEKAPSRLVRPPRVAGAPAAFECRLITRVSLPSNDPDMDVGAIFGEAVGVHIDDAMLDEGMVDVTRYQPLSRLGYLDYASVREVFPMPRPPKPND